MKFKTSAIALAIASIVSVPMVASAEGSLYASARYGFSSADSGVTGEDTVNSLHNFGSRIGIKGSTDLGNGMTGYGQWEAHLFGGGLRDFKVGVKGDFGDIYMGDGINHAWDSVMSTDGTWWYGGGMHLTDGVQSNAITYQGGGGGVSFGVTIQMAGEFDANDDPEPIQEDMDATELVVSFDVGDITLAVGITDVEGSETITGLLAKGSAGDFYWAVDYQMQDAVGTFGDRTSLQFEGGTGPFLVQYGMLDDDTGAEPTALVLTYTKSLGPDTLVYFEYFTKDSDGGDDPNTLGIVLKHNLL
ncbi:MAG: porin [Proteobacteria bacterium]|nr:porin [Pseudomonadota bacterium]